MVQEKFPYLCDEQEMMGYLSFEEGEEVQPSILILPAWRGVDSFATEIADALAGCGYAALVADLYGGGTYASDNEKAMELMLPLFLNRKLLQERCRAAHRVLLSLSQIDATRSGAIGFCFGGLAAIELLRSGAPLSGVVAFHPLLGKTIEGKEARLAPIAPEITAALLLLHGHLDPMVSAEDIATFQKEMVEAKIDWEMDIYGGAMHAFTNPEANDPEFGTLYHPQSCERAMARMYAFFEEIFAR